MLKFPINPFLVADYYKFGHPFDFPKGFTEGYSNMTPRGSRMTGVTHMVWFGLQVFVQAYLVELFNEQFFKRDKKEVLDEYKEFMESTSSPLPSYEHIAYIHDMQYLPIEIKSVPEGTLVPMRIPGMTIRSTEAKCGWLTNFIETMLSMNIWLPCCSATIAHEYRKTLDEWAIVTGMPADFVPWQGHDFSMRGMGGFDAAVTSAMGHLLSFTGTDTAPAILAMKHYYDADYTKALVGGSVWATEHAVICAGGKETELETYRRLITEVTPSGIKSIVSDTWDLWNVITVILPQLKDEIMNRQDDKYGNAKVVIRPDSGDPVKIICGSAYPLASLEEEEFELAFQAGFDLAVFEGTYHHIAEDIGVEGQVWHAPFEGEVTPAMKGVVELLWEIFGGTQTVTEFKLLDRHIGCIYGDSITIERANQICYLLAAKGFASQCVFGIGSFTYQHNTRDTFGMAMKSTNVVINGESVPIFKDPVTDDGLKRSALGLLRVRRVDDDLVLDENVTEEEEKQGVLQTVFLNGSTYNRTNLTEIRSRLAKGRALQLIRKNNALAALEQAACPPAECLVPQVCGEDLAAPKLA